MSHVIIDQSMSVINMLGHDAFATAFGGGGGSTTEQTTYQPPVSGAYYQCSKHSWYGDIAYRFSCPSCEFNTNKSCHSCKNVFKFVNPEQLLTVHYSRRKPTNDDKIIRKFSKGNRRVIYFCSGKCYQSYEENKKSCIIS